VVYMRQEKLKLLAATGTAKHRNAQVSTGRHSQRGQQGKVCYTATRLFREGTSPRRAEKREKSRATVTAGCLSGLSGLDFLIV